MEGAACVLHSCTLLVEGLEPDGDDLVGVHHLGEFRRCVDLLMVVGRNLRDLEQLAVLGDLIGEPLLAGCLSLLLVVHAGEYMVELCFHRLLVWRTELRELPEEVWFALSRRPRQLMREQVVAGHEVQDVVDAADVSRRDQTACRDAEHVAKVKLLRFHGIASHMSRSNGVEISD